MMTNNRPGAPTMPENSGNLLLIAAREPTPGQTKTRLGGTIGMQAAAALYRAFLVDLAERFTPASEENDYTLGWAFSPPECNFASSLQALSPLALQRGVLFVPQDGPDWGIRQANLLRWGRDHGFARTVLTASDSPHMSVSAIVTAFQALDSHDIALGRVHDGGYYLIGMRGFHDVLLGVPMSTSSAADALLFRAKTLGLTVADIPATFDVDVEDDLTLLHELLNRDPGSAPATAQALRSLGLARQSSGARGANGA